MEYDLIVVGAGPAGSTAAREAASEGASVLLLDRAQFPRDKPCGGGVNVRAADLLPFSIAPVTERTVSGLQISLNLRGGFARHYPYPLSYMTQRSRFDAYLVEQATRAGARLCECATVRSVEVEKHGLIVRTGSQSFQGRFLVGADGANGIVARACGLDGGRRLAVALEGHFPNSAASQVRWRETIAMDLGIIPGGYGWLFPKDDHFNIGVGGWQHYAPSLRGRLDRLAAHFGLVDAAPSYLRGHHLPVRLPNAPIARGRVALTGDAAGFIDPLSGEGIYSAIFSGGLAGREAIRCLASGATSFDGYVRAIETSLAPDLIASQRFQDVFHLMPRVYGMLLKRSDRLWDVLCHLVRGEETYLDLRRRIGPVAGLVDLMSYVVRHTPLGVATGIRL